MREILVTAVRSHCGVDHWAEAAPTVARLDIEIRWQDATYWMPAELLANLLWDGCLAARGAPESGWEEILLTSDGQDLFLATRHSSGKQLLLGLSDQRAPLGSEPLEAGRNQAPAIGEPLQKGLGSVGSRRVKRET